MLTNEPHTLVKTSFSSPSFKKKTQKTGKIITYFTKRAYVPNLKSAPTK